MPKPLHLFENHEAVAAERLRVYVSVLDGNETVEKVHADTGISVARIQSHMEYLRSGGFKLNKPRKIGRSEAARAEQITALMLLTAERDNKLLCLVGQVKDALRELDRCAIDYRGLNAFVYGMAAVDEIAAMLRKGE